ncbi:MAG: UDP-N-acetylmuramyl-tripeptide synthetase [Nannocystis sp.]|nr:UDP-N-acetylmuramyl-tripeptide synthetase [Nannocystis sp.]MBA3546857.1 UDP-N-acetylmuramyl-tripeptide synthetase [Nannocystis sp.]
MRPVAAAAPWAAPLFTVGVTGTNGKTSTTWMIAAALRAAALSTLRISTLGVALDDEAWPRGKKFSDFLGLLERAAARGCRHAVIEATSLALAQGYARTWRFDLGVFTNLSPDHFATHGSWEHYLAAKAQLFMALGPGRTAVLNAADPHALYIDQAIPADVERRWFAAPGRGERLHTADLEAASLEVSVAGTRVQLQPSPAATALGGVLETRMIGEVFAENALAAALAGLAAGLPPDAVARGIAACPVVPGRFEVLAHGDDRATIVIDYAHSPDALAHTCKAARALAGGAGRVIVVFGAGGDATPSKRAPMGAAVGVRADLAIVTSDNPRDEDPAAIAAMVVEGLRGGRASWTVALDRKTAITRAIGEARPGDVVVIAGKGHEQGQVIRGRSLPFSDAEVARRWLAR